MTVNLSELTKSSVELHERPQRGSRNTVWNERFVQEAELSSQKQLLSVRSVPQCWNHEIIVLFSLTSGIVKAPPDRKHNHHPSTTSLQFYLEKLSQYLLENYSSEGVTVWRNLISPIITP